MKINTPSSVPYNINQNATQAEKTLGKIAAAKEIGLQDAASRAIADQIGMQVDTLGQGIRNGNDAIGIMQIADQALSDLSRNSERLNALSVRYGNAALNSDQGAMLQNEFNATVDAMQQSVEGATFNGTPIFGQNMTFSLGTSDISTTISSIEFSTLNINDQNTILAFSDQIASIASDVGAASNSVQSAIRNSLDTIKNLSASRSQLEDTDIGKAATDFNKQQLQFDASLIVQAHQTSLRQERIADLLK